MQSVVVMQRYKYQEPEHLPVPTHISNLIYNFVGSRCCELCGKTFKKNNSICYPIHIIEVKMRYPMYRNRLRLTTLYQNSKMDCNGVICTKCTHNINRDSTCIINTRSCGRYRPRVDVEGFCWCNAHILNFRKFLTRFSNDEGYVESKYYK